jgi:hypothetical protein
VPEHPFDRLGPVEVGQGDRFGHLDLDSGGASGGCLDQPQSGTFAEGEELGLGRVDRFGLAVEWTGRWWRIVSVVDPGGAWRRTLVSGHFHSASV